MKPGSTIWQRIGRSGLLWCLLAPLLLPAAEADLSGSEREWIRSHPVAKFSFDPDWLPFSYIDEGGDFAGIDADFLALLSERTGLTFEAVQARNWAEAYELALSGRVDFLVSTAKDASREPHFEFTRAYLDFPVAVIGRINTPAVTSMDGLHNHVVASPRGHVATLALARDYPDLRILETDTLDGAFLSVARGDADVAVVNIASANYAIGKLGLGNLRVVGTLPDVFQLRYAVRRDRPELHAILDKGVASISRAERQRIVAPWIKFDFVEIIRWDRVQRWAAGLLLIAMGVVGFFIWHNRSLRRELDERLRIQRELERAHDRLKGLNDEKAGLMRMAAHDLRGPLGGLLLNLDLLRMEKVGPEGVEALDRMMLLSHQMIHMVRNLLDVEALENGSRNFRPEPVDFVAAVREALATAVVVAERKRIAVLFEPAPALPPVMADRSALRQVTDNLLSNAIKYSLPGTTVTVRLTRTADRHIRLAVADQGPGVTAEDMPRLFQRYACLSARPTGGELSTGLGLSIVRELVERMEGRVWCESAPEEGASFLVELPESSI
ncbi:MAG: transporter substrate-binding domain-containing protein [Verrucomicrobiota bacterium]